MDGLAEDLYFLSNIFHRTNSLAIFIDNDAHIYFGS